MPVVIILNTMKHGRILILMSLLCGSWTEAGEFINLDFEQADLTGSQIEYRTIIGEIPARGYPFGTGPIASLLPGWRVEIGAEATNTMAIGNGFFGIDPNNDPQPIHVSLIVPGNYLSDFPPYQGQYALAINNLDVPVGGSRVIRVVQVGTVPTDAELLSFLMPKIASVGLVVDDNAFRPSQSALVLRVREKINWSFAGGDLGFWPGATKKHSQRFCYIIALFNATNYWRTAYSRKCEFS